MKYNIQLECKNSECKSCKNANFIFIAFFVFMDNTKKEKPFAIGLFLLYFFMK